MVAIYWLVSAKPLLGRMRLWRDPLGGIPLGLVASLACVPPIALTLRSNPELAHGLVSTFLSGLLFLVIAPAALAAREVHMPPWPLWLTAGALGASFLGFAPNALTQVGLLGFGLLLLAPVLAADMPLHLRGVWLGVAGGVIALAVELLPNTHSVALGAIHFLILGPVICSLAPRWLRRQPPVWLWSLGHVLWGSMSFALVMQAFVDGAWTWKMAAYAGSGIALWWSGVLVWSLRSSDN